MADGFSEPPLEMSEAPSSPVPSSPARSVAATSNAGTPSRASTMGGSQPSDWSPHTAAGSPGGMTDGGRSVANTPGADSVYPNSEYGSPGYRSTPGSAAPRPRGGGRWSSAGGAMFTPPEGGQSDAGDGGGGGGDGPGAGVEEDGQFGDDHGFGGAANSTIVWGTTISLHDAMNQAKQFLRDFTAGDGEPLYPQLLAQAKTDDSYNLNIDAKHLRTFGSEHNYNLYRDLVRYPQEMIPIFDLCVYEEFQRMYGEEESQKRFQVRIFNLETVKAMRDLNPKDIDTLVAVQGMVVRASAIQPDLKQAYFECSACNHAVVVSIDRGRINEPDACQQCSAKFSCQLIHNRCLFTDKQVVKMQETPESMPEGETPTTITVCAYDDLVDHGKPGDRAVITGVYRAVPMRVNPRLRTEKTVFRTYIDVIHYQKNTDSRFAAENARAEKGSEFATQVEERADLTAELEKEEREMEEMSKDPDIYPKLVQSLAPSIYELEDVKKGILCQLFGGTNKTLGDAMVNCRGELNVILVGDPGTAKSQLLNYVHKIAPRGIYTSGQGSSAVGLTAYVTRDPDSGEMVLESGALVLSDRGVCCIDEFDKMSDITRAVLHEAMEQQTVSVAKAGIICSLNARTSVLAAANPIESRYNPRKSVVENINLPPTLLSRFDLIYLVLDKADERMDSLLAGHLVSLYFKTLLPKMAGSFPVKQLTKYVSYARRTCHPRMNSGAKEQLIEHYVEMRAAGMRNKTVTSTPRQLESLIRLAESNARMRLGKEVTEDDVAEAVRLMTAATLTAATNPETGEIDMDLITTGRSASDRERIDQIRTECLSMVDEVRGEGFNARDMAVELRERTRNPDVSTEDVRAALDMLVNEGEIREGSNGSYKKRRA